MSKDDSRRGLLQGLVGAGNGRGLGGRGDMGVDPLGVLGVGVLVGVWYAAAAVASPTVLPSPTAVVERMVSDFREAPALEVYGLPETGLWPNLRYTMVNVFIAMTIGTVMGTLIGLVSARVSAVRTIMTPLVATAGTIPILIAAPFFLVWFGVDRWSAILLVALYSTTVLIIFSERAAENLNPVYEQAASTFGARRGKVVKDILIPGTIPEILGGVRIALAGAWGLEAIAELLGLERGIGQVIRILSTSFDAEGIMAAVLLLSIVAVGVDGLVVIAVRRLTGWRSA